MSKAILGTHLACLITMIVSIFLRAYTDDIGHWSEPAWLGMIMLCTFFWIVFGIVFALATANSNVKTLERGEVVS